MKIKISKDGIRIGRNAYEKGTVLSVSTSIGTKLLKEKSATKYKAPKAKEEK